QGPGPPRGGGRRQAGAADDVRGETRPGLEGGAFAQEIPEGILLEVVVLHGGGDSFPPWRTLWRGESCGRGEGGPPGESDAAFFAPEADVEAVAEAPAVFQARRGDGGRVAVEGGGIPALGHDEDAVRGNGEAPL